MWPEMVEIKKKSVTTRPQAEGADDKKCQIKQKYPVSKQSGLQTVCSSASRMGIASPYLQASDTSMGFSSGFGGA